MTSARRAGAAALVGAALTGCLHVPTPRQAGPGEGIVLDALTVRIPEEPGWSVEHTQVWRDQWLTLAHAAPDGRVDRRVRVVQVPGPPGHFDSLGQGSRAFVVKGLSPAAGLPAEDLRTSPLVARFGYRIEPPGGDAGAGIQPATYATWLFVAPRRPDRTYRLTYVEPDAPGDQWRAGFEQRAEAFLEHLRLHGAGPTPRPTPPEAAFLPQVDVALGVASFGLLGEAVVGLDERLTFGLATLSPRAGTGRGWDLATRILAGRRGKLEQSAVLLPPGGWVGLGPLRLRASADLGYAVQQDRSTSVRREGAVLGGSLTASVDLRQGEWFDWSIGAEGSLGTQRLRAAGLRLGLRWH